MPAALFYVVLLLMTLVPGCLLLRAVAGRRTGAPDSLAEWLFRGGVAGLGLLLGIALVLVELRLFTLGRLLAGLGGLSVLCGALAWRRGGWWRPPRPRWEDLRPLLLIVLFWLVAGRTHEYIVGADDQGTYVSIAGSIARTGGILFQDADLAAMEPAWATQQFLFQTVFGTEYTITPLVPVHYYYLPGFYALDEPWGTIVPQFYHLYPTWLAVGYRLADLEGLLWSVPWLGMWSLLALYFLGRKMLGPVAGTGAALLLVGNLAFSWFARYPCSEMLAQLGLWTALYALFSFQQRAPDDPGAGVLAALALGLLVHARVDAVLGLAGLAAWLLPVALHEAHFFRRWRAFLLPAGLVLAHLAVYLALFGRWYLLFTSVGLIQYLLRPPVAVGVLALGAALVAALVYLVRAGLLRRFERWLRWGLVVALVGGALGAYFVWPILSPPQLSYIYANTDWIPLTSYNGENFVRLGWYMTPLGLGLAVLGLAAFARRKPLVQVALLFLPLAAYSIYLYRNADVPYHIHTLRRFIVALIPGLFLGLGYALEWLRRRLPGWIGRAVPLVLGTVLLAVTWQPTWTLRQHVDFSGATAALRGLAGRFEEPSVILFSDLEAAEVFGKPLRFLFGRQVLALRPAQADAAGLRRLVEGWNRAGRPVYLVVCQGASRIPPGTLDFEWVGQETFDFPRFIRTSEEPPSEVGPARFVLTLYRLHPAGRAVTSASVVDVGGDDYAYLVRGFWGPEVLPDGTSFRWTQGEAAVDLPGDWFTSPGPLTLTLRMEQNWTTAERPSTVSLSLGGSLLAQFVPRPEWSIYTVPLSDDLRGRLGGETVVLTLRSTTWQPSAEGLADDRSLGVALDWITIEK